MAGSGRQMIGAQAAWQKVRGEVDKKMRQAEVNDTVRESRAGYRGMGMFQLTKYYSAEGVYVIDIGGPPLAGR
jgi:hypothetical protein